MKLHLTLCVALSALALTACGNDDRNWVALDDHDVRFVAPDGWNELDLAADPVTSVMLTTLLKEADLDPEVLTAGRDLVEIQLVDSTYTSGMPNTLTATVLRDEELPSEVAAVDRYALFGSTVEDADAVTTDAGDAVTVTYSWDIAGVTVAGSTLAVDLGDDLLQIVITSDSPETSRAAAETVLATIQPT
jgi:hypothetical protein